jgi:hypothetical protein
MSTLVLLATLAIPSLQTRRFSLKRRLRISGTFLQE